jgi:hypothetical protein
MATSGVPGFGSGGTPNFLPGRGYREYGSATYRDAPDWNGGARGPAAIPARITNPVPPAPADAPRNVFEAINPHRGAFIEDAGAPRLEFENVVGHGDIKWSRPFFPNIAGLRSFRAPTQMPSWSANAVPQVDRPSVPIPSGHKRIDNFTVRRPYGDTSTGQLFPTTYSLQDFVRAIQQGMKMQGRRWMRQSKTHNPTLVNRSVYAMAGSYGQTTSTLNTAPTNAPVSAFGVY